MCASHIRHLLDCVRCDFATRGSGAHATETPQRMTARARGAHHFPRVLPGRRSIIKWLGLVCFCKFICYFTHFIVRERPRSIINNFRTPQSVQAVELILYIYDGVCNHHQFRASASHRTASHTWLLTPIWSACTNKNSRNNNKNAHDVQLTDRH